MNPPTLPQLQRAVQVHQQIATLQTELNSVLNAVNSNPAARWKPLAKRGLSAAGRARIAAAQKARWAKIKAAKK